MSGFRRRRYLATLRLAQAAVFWERLWPAIWPALGIAGIFAGLALLDVLPVLPSWLHALILAAFGAALVAALVVAVRTIRPVPREHARRRVERDSNLAHHPLAALEDYPATGTDDARSQALWREHVRRAEAAITTTSVALPRPNMAGREPWGLRAGVVLLLFVALAASGGEFSQRLDRAVNVKFDNGGGIPTNVEVWVTPAAYTRFSPVYRSSGDGVVDNADGAVVAPVGSEVLVRVAGSRLAPRVVIGANTTAMEPIDGGSDTAAFSATATLEEGDRLAVETRSATLAAWSLEVIPDHAPRIGFANPPTPAGNGLLRTAFAATDDFGVRDVLLEIFATEASSALGGAPLIRTTLTLPAIDAKQVSNSELLDFAAHHLAGTTVMMRLAAIDARSQTGYGPLIEMVLPERTFEHPVARAIIAARRELVDETGAVRRRVAERLADIAAQPDHYAHKTVVTLALSVARARLLRASDAAVVPSVRHLLWETALGLEQGTVASAERDLRNARQELWEALRNDAPAEEIERLMDALQAALDRFMNAVAAEMARRGQTEGALSPDAEQVRSSDLRELIEMARDLARTGARKDARQLLAQLQRILDQIRVGLDSGSDSKRLVEAHKIMQALRGVAQAQQELLDETFEQLRAMSRPQALGPQGPGRQGEDGEDGGGRAARSRDAEKQEALRRELGDLMLRLDAFTGGIPAPLGEAERSMRGSTSALQGSRLGDAVESQGEALEALQRAEQSAAQSMAQQLGGSAGLFAGDPDDDGSGGRDIFGRSRGDGYRGVGAGPIEIPDQPAVHRAQEIRKELQRRAGDRDRPEVELDYIDRLLDVF